VYKIKSSGPRTDPCGTPYQTYLLLLGREGAGVAAVVIHWFCEFNKISG